MSSEMQPAPETVTTPPDPAVVQTAAEQEYQRILKTFNVEHKTEGDKQNVIEAIIEGRVILDEAKELLTYKFAKPIELKTGAHILQIVFHEPDNADLEYINKGQTVSANIEGEKKMSLDLSESFLKTSRVLSRICDLPIGVADRIKRRDILVIKSLCDFFG